jgi:formamidopyrimidine-DNA glycosylase
MPELPEVETVLRGIKEHVLGVAVEAVVVRCAALRWPIPKHLKEALSGQTISGVVRRAKYLLFMTSSGTMIIHLGMSGHLRILPKILPAEKHDHCDIILSSGSVLRYTDPRRFGCVLWTDSDPFAHRLLAKLGPEPLSRAFSSRYLHRLAGAKKSAIKSVIMDSHNVVGIGNIYAAEALFESGILPDRPAFTLSLDDCATLVRNIKKTLRAAITQGGVTLKDFYGVKGQKGYFAISLLVYGRDGELCINCKTILKLMNIGGRSTVYCDLCQR